MVVRAALEGTVLRGSGGGVGSGEEEEEVPLASRPAGVVDAQSVSGMSGFTARKERALTARGFGV